MSDFFNWDNKFMTAMSKASDAILLGILWIACCLPIVTVGASSAAFYYAYHKAVRQRRGYAWKEFFSAFKSNFKSAIIIWLIILGLYLVTGMDCYILYTSLETMDHALFLLLMIMIVIALITIWGIYVFPYLARFENTTKVIIKNSIAVMVMNKSWSLLLLVIFVAAAALFLLVPPAAIFVPAFYMWVDNKILERIFRKYMRKEDLEKQIELDRARSGMI